MANGENYMQQGDGWNSLTKVGRAEEGSEWGSYMKIQRHFTIQ